MSLDERKYRILMAIIDDYITTAMPVGSRTISKRQDVGGLSSATIRNEMSDLTDMGYLEQPHTSAGRIPAESAYRLYVDSLLTGTQKLPTEEARRLHTHFDKRAKQVDAIIESAAQAISDVTHYTSIVTAPVQRGMRLRHIQLLPLTESSLLMVIITNLGMVKNQVLPIETHLDAEQLHQLSRMLTEQLAGLSPERVQEKLLEISDTFSLHREMVSGLLSSLQASETQGITVGGRSNIFNHPEYSNTEKARGVLRALETRETLSKLMQTSPRLSFTIRIGDETGVAETSDSSVVSMTYSIGDDTTGTIGVIGPMRMQYAKVIPVLDYMGKALRELLLELGADDPGKRE